MNHLVYLVEELRAGMDAKAFIQQKNAQVRTLLTDSRKLSDVHQAIFFALKGRRNGHDFIAGVYEEGVRSFVISEPEFDLQKFEGANFYLVEDTLRALQDLVATHRAKFTYPVIGITGSNGKTIVKEWLSQLLMPEHRIVRSPRSYNSQLGVPVSVWQMTAEHNLAIFEAGISKSGEMATLVGIIRPTIGILTNIGEAHKEGFKSLADKITEKLLLFSDVDLFIYSKKYLSQYNDEIPGKRKFSWGYHDGADLEIIDDEPLENCRILRANYNGKEVETTIPFTDQASIENVIICWATLLALGYEPEEASKRLAALHPVSMRLEMKNGIHDCSVIDDSYSLDLSSLSIALDFLKQQNQHPKRTLILSDLPGENSEQVYQQLAQMLESKSVNRIIGVGETISRYGKKFPGDQQFFLRTEDLIRAFPLLEFDNETILLKGARIFGFERISRLLTQKVHETVLEINLNAMEHNLNYYKSLLPAGTKLMAMVKAFSYGSGSFEIANLLEFNKVDYLAVAYVDEGVALRNAGSKLPIMVMSPDSMVFETMIEHNLEPEIYSMRILIEFTEALRRKNMDEYAVHIKLDTGMHRLGFMESELESLIQFISENQVLRIHSVFSHLAASNDPLLDEFTEQQISLFEHMSHQICRTLSYPVILHLANTSAISRWPQAAFGMVRLGIGLYGIDPALKNESPLQTVTSLKTTISQIKFVHAGETVGYGRAGKMPDGGTIATIKIGYADGYNRRFGNGLGRMLVKGEEVRTVGHICMDMCMIDISGIQAEEGDEVIVFNDIIRVEDLAEQLGTIPYEVLTGISQRVKRVYYYE